MTTIPHLRRALSAAILAGVVVFAGPARGQCCLGAQDVAHTTADGRFRVEARSLLGTGVGVHGPYQYEFTSLARDDAGVMQPTGRFQRNWDTRTHFSMTIYVSPTGNGFLLSCSLEPDLLFLAADGTTLSTIRRPDARTGYVCDPSDDGLFVHFSGNRLAGGVQVAHRTAIFLPLGAITGPEKMGRYGKDPQWQPCPPERLVFLPDEKALASLRAAIVWSPAVGARELAAATAAVQGLLAAAPADVAAAQQRVVEFGLSGEPPLREALGRTKGEADGKQRERLQAATTALRQRLVGYEAPWRDLDLLLSLLQLPHLQLAADARSQLGRLLPENAEATAAWIAEHRAELRWDEPAGRYVRAQSP